MYEFLQNKTIQTIACFSSLAMWLGSFIITAVTKNPITIFLMVCAHTTQSIVIGIKTGARDGLDMLTSLAKCLCYGFAWWLPLLLKLNREEG